MQNSLLSGIAITLYLLTAAIIAWQLFKLRGKFSDTHHSLKKYSVIALGLSAVVLHGIVLYDNLFVPDGINLGVFNAISLITLLIALTILVASLTNPVENLGILLLPVAALAILLSGIYPVEHTILTVHAIELKTHILLSIVAYSLLTIAAVQSMALAIQDHHLRNKKPGGFIRALPPLQTMESLLFQMIAFGFFIHSLSLITGIIYLEDIFAQHLVHKSTLAVIAWLIFATLLWGRWRFGWRGATAIRWTLGGFSALALSYVGSKWVMEIILGR